VAQSRSTDPLRPVSDVPRRVDVAVDLDSGNARILRVRTDSVGRTSQCHDGDPSRWTTSIIPPVIPRSLMPHGKRPSAFRID
jgi:hypothetical protein